MSQDHSPATNPPTAGLPRWKKTLLGLSLALMIVGGALRGYAYVQKPREQPAAPPPSQQPAATAAPGAARGFVSGAPRAQEPEPAAPASAPAADPQPTAIEEWSPAMVKLGFSFFAGFCIAFALRTVFKIAATVIGVVILAAMGLKYAGLVQVDWSMIAGKYESAAAWMMAQVGSFKQFVTGQLPSASAAVVGLYSGWKRK